MLFPTIDFAVFFAVVFAVTWLLNRHNDPKKWFLVAASYLFYAAWNPNYLFILFGSSLGNYLLALWMGPLPDGRRRKALLIFGVIANLTLLGVFKYYNFFVAETVNALVKIGVQVQPRFLEIALPVAISFITFHALSYLIDVYRRELKPTKSLVDILLYISFFPHLVAGPIVRAKDFLSQTARVSDPESIRLGFSVFLILSGLFKKVIVANYLSTDFVDNAFQNPAGQSSIDLWLAMYGYALQIYCDFSAYTDIAIGIANLLGYQFPQNFNQPYRALSLQDFWRRWHITLSSWLRDYLFIPLGGSRGTSAQTYAAIMITMLLGGLWHGASWNFVIWGALHGAMLVLERILHLTGKGSETRLPRWLAWLITFHFVCFTWIFFRSQTFDAALDYFRTMFSFGSFAATITPLVALMFVFGALTQIVSPVFRERLENWYDRAPLPVKIVVPVLVIYLIAVAAPDGVPPFIYFQF
ncbi:MAG TPA: MBOAT family protein [Xanthobacteraceae bacterium]|nr:MBOAT family protein [Xanthobacteraceae bacterium]